jgi:hypothetical protein
MVGSVIPVIGAGEVDGWPIAWLHMWAAPILLDPNWSDGDYYGKAEPVAGLSTALAMVTLHAQHWAWTNSSAFGRKWAVEGKDPASCLLECKYAIEAALDNGARRAPRPRTPTISSTSSRLTRSLSRAAAISLRDSRRSTRPFCSLPATTILSSPPTR